jgi:hypothetical protein
MTTLSKCSVIGLRFEAGDLLRLGYFAGRPSP